MRRAGRPLEAASGRFDEVAFWQGPSINQSANGSSTLEADQAAAELMAVRRPTKPLTNAVQPVQIELVDGFDGDELHRRALDGLGDGVALV